MTKKKLPTIIEECNANWNAPTSERLACENPRTAPICSEILQFT